MMSPVFRLDSVSPTLAESFRKASPAQRRHAALVACELVASSVGFADQEVVLALDVLRGGGAANALLREQLEDLAARFDDEYLRLNEEADESKQSEVLRLFSKARVASALAFALADDAAQLHEAICEALAAMDDTGELVRSAERALR